MKRYIITALTFSLIGCLCACNTAGNNVKSSQVISQVSETQSTAVSELSEESSKESSSEESSEEKSSEEENSEKESSEEESSEEESSEEESSEEESSEEESSEEESSEEESSEEESSEEESSEEESSEEESSEEESSEEESSEEESSEEESSEEESSEEESSMEPASSNEIQYIDGVAYIDGIIIVNKTYSLPEYYGYGEDTEALNAFYEMQNDAYNDDIYLEIISGYRSYETQVYTYNSFVYDRGTELADRVSARPGHSEHQTGLAFDINTTANYFADTPEAEWLAEHCAEYGFIIRYPMNKEYVTGYAYEPWHIRYIGREKARIITDSGLTLEEYYGLTSFYS